MKVPIIVVVLWLHVPVLGNYALLNIEGVWLLQSGTECIWTLENKGHGYGSL